MVRGHDFLGAPPVGLEHGRPHLGLVNTGDEEVQEVYTLLGCEDQALIRPARETVEVLFPRGYPGRSLPLEEEWPEVLTGNPDCKTTVQDFLVRAIRVAGSATLQADPVNAHGPLGYSWGDGPSHVLPDCQDEAVGDDVTRPILVVQTIPVHLGEGELLPASTTAARETYFLDLDLDRPLDRLFFERELLLRLLPAALPSSVVSPSLVAVAAALALSAK